MRNLIVFSAGYLTAWIVIFAAISFISWGFNPGNWTPFGRGLVLFIGQIPSILAGSFALGAWGK